MDLVPLIVTSTLMLTFNLGVAGVEHWWSSLPVMPLLLWLFRPGGRVRLAVVSVGQFAARHVVRMARRAKEFFEDENAPSPYQRVGLATGGGPTPVLQKGRYAALRRLASHATANDSDTLISSLTRTSYGVGNLFTSFWATLQASMRARLDPERHGDGSLPPLLFFLIAYSIGAFVFACASSGFSVFELLPQNWWNVPSIHVRAFFYLTASVVLFALADALHWAVRLSFLLQLVLAGYEQLAQWLPFNMPGWSWMPLVVISTLIHTPNLWSELSEMFAGNEQRTVRWGKIFMGLGLLVSVVVGVRLQVAHEEQLGLWLVAVTFVTGISATKRVRKVHWNVAFDTMATVVSIIAPMLALFIFYQTLQREMVDLPMLASATFIVAIVFGSVHVMRWKFSRFPSMFVPLLVAMSASGYSKDPSVPGHIQVTPTAVRFRPCGQDNALPLVFNKNTKGWPIVQAAIEKETVGVNEGWERAPEVLWARLTRSGTGEQIVVKQFCCVGKPSVFEPGVDLDKACYRKCPKGDDNANPCEEPKSAQAP